jgi:hypothetical protein
MPGEWLWSLYVSLSRTDPFMEPQRAASPVLPQAKFAKPSMPSQSCHASSRRKSSTSSMLSSLRPPTRKLSLPPHAVIQCSFLSRVSCPCGSIFSACSQVSSQRPLTAAECSDTSTISAPLTHRTLFGQDSYTCPLTRHPLARTVHLQRHFNAPPTSR